MKKLWIIVLVALLLAGCGGGNTDLVEIGIGPSALYSESEIEAAMDLVLRNFERGWEGCVMLNLWYDEEATLEEARERAEDYGAEQVIILYSNYWVDGSGRNPTQNPNSLYKNWSWILARNGRQWELKDCGY